MATRSSEGNDKSVRLPAAIVAVVALLIVVGLLAYKNLGPAQLPPEKPSPNANRIMKIFTDSGGDWDKVSAADQQWIHQYSGGREAMAWASIKAAKAKH